MTTVTIPNLGYSSAGKIGVGLNRRTTTAEHKLGDTVLICGDQTNFIARLAIYVQANGAIGANSYVTVDLSSISCLASSVVSGGAPTTQYLNTSAAFTDKDYGWLITQADVIPNVA